MAKSLSERILERHKRINSSTNKSSRAIFLVFLDEIKKAASEGWSAKAIWKMLRDEKKVNFCYTTFLRYFNRESVKKSVTVAKKKTQVGSCEMRGFVHNPIPNIDELV